MKKVGLGWSGKGSQVLVSTWHFKFERTIKHASDETMKVGKQPCLWFRQGIQVRDKHLGVVNTQIIHKAMGLEEISAKFGDVENEEESAHESAKGYYLKWKKKQDRMKSLRQVK